MKALWWRPACAHSHDTARVRQTVWRPSCQIFDLDSAAAIQDDFMWATVGNYSEPSAEAAIVLKLLPEYKRDAIGFGSPVFGFRL